MLKPLVAYLCFRMMQGTEELGEKQVHRMAPLPGLRLKLGTYFLWGDIANHFAIPPSPTLYYLPHILTDVIFFVSHASRPLDTIRLSSGLELCFYCRGTTTEFPQPKICFSISIFQQTQPGCYRRAQMLARLCRMKYIFLNQPSQSRQFYMKSHSAITIISPRWANPKTPC